MCRKDLDEIFEKAIYSTLQPWMTAGTKPLASVLAKLPVPALSKGLQMEVENMLE
jgi:hypothetical protein